SVYILEDFSSALVRVEFSAKAGFSSQSPENAGFFPLYTRLFKYASPDNQSLLSDLECECNADSSRYIIKTTAVRFNTVLQAMATCAFNPVFQTADLERELARAKKEVSETAFSIEGFINASIDSRVFADSPWKHDSGIYPQLFTKISTSASRMVLTGIQKRYYAPKNCALFISGPVSTQKALEAAEKFFSGGAGLNANLADNSGVAGTAASAANERKKLFVLSDPEFSPDMTQIVVQYTSLSMEECDYAAAIMDSDNSILKTELLQESSLGIRAPQYINAASTHKNGSSRLIIQSLLENPKASPYKNAQGFVSIVKNSIGKITDSDFDIAKDTLVYSFEHSMENSVQFMDYLSQFWAVKDYKAQKENEKLLSLSQKFFLRPDDIRCQRLDSIKEHLLEEEPFVFVLVNSKFLEHYKKSFEGAGYEIVTVKNGSWYTQALYKTLRENLSVTEVEEENSDFESEDLFALKNENTIETYSLSNSIPLIINQRKNTNTVCLNLEISGGELFNSKNEYGLESVLVSCFAFNIERSLYQKFNQKIIHFIPEVQCDTGIFSSTITVECLAQDLNEVIDSCSEALIFSEIQPALVDTIVMQKKSNQIVKNSSPVFQLYANGVNTLFKTKEYQNIFLQPKDILKNISYAKVMQAYPAFLNAARYKIFIAGKIDDPNSVKNNLELAFGILKSGEALSKKNIETQLPSRKTKKIKLVHLFLTDVSREKAGPRPQVLIPTTEFLDPAQFWIYNEAGKENQAKFNAVVFDFAKFLQAKLSEAEATAKVIVKVQVERGEVPFAVLTFLNVKKVSSIENVYQQALKDYAELLSEQSCASAIELWIKNELEDTLTNRGMCFLMSRGIFEDENSAKFVKDYTSVHDISIESMQNVVAALELDKVYRFYSADTPQ
uniref:insulinase family protein n=1 Tax=Treponema sp. TaxID=166 RepID=UPI00298E2935